ncbi:putative C2H2-type zinc-finger transcription factor orf8 [Fusarium oxysporum f. sp. rapae]|uniref:Putative C2H2-type zinc-finger transcription factor orf8 n=1 Tax=Fusarium oxysporum f. sp. rapae TaxID=485398 RepID=A0A8J5NNQ4_FUSOX|nr:putative C2H2-type zinc-finger transcription factor orf8 [Fusarium oxysporum f. sp. rapae]KAG7409484.1 putative C2H2-type zinc-finger transcription factor orf8 [Fusarium oxysporum f. sp. rapae]
MWPYYKHLGSYNLMYYIPNLVFSLESPEELRRIQMSLNFPARHLLIAATPHIQKTLPRLQQSQHQLTSTCDQKERSTCTTTIAIHFDLAFSTGQRSAFTQPSLPEASAFRSSILGPELPSMGNISGDSLTPLPQSRPAKLNPSRLYPSVDQLEVKRQSERWHRDMRLSKRRRCIKSNCFIESQPSITELPSTTTTVNIPAYTASLPVTLMNSISTILSSSTYLQSHSSATIEHQQPQLAPVSPTTYPQSLQVSYNMPANYAAAYAIFNQTQSPPAPIGQNTSFVYQVPTLMGSGGTNTQAGHVGILQSPLEPRCWEHGCDGRQFSSFGNLRRHRREKSGKIAKVPCPNCGARFTRTTARNEHLLNGKCKGR